MHFLSVWSIHSSPSEEFLVNSNVCGQPETPGHTGQRPDISVMDTWIELCGPPSAAD